jgi:hypothetical protein
MKTSTVTYPAAPQPNYPSIFDEKDFVDVELANRPSRVDQPPRPSSVATFFRRRTVRVVLITLLVVLSCAVIAGGAAYGLAKVNGNDTSTAASDEPSIPTPTYTIQARGHGDAKLGNAVPIPPPAASPARDPINPDALREFYYPRPLKRRQHVRDTVCNDNTGSCVDVDHDALEEFGKPRGGWRRSHGRQKPKPKPTPTPTPTPTAVPINPDALREFDYPRPQW